MFKEYMREALLEAEKAFRKGEVPVGAVVVKDGEIIGRGHNLKETLKDPTAHAEMIAIREASKSLNNWRLNDCDIYVTLEPCPMCVGAIVEARIKRLVFGAFDVNMGACGSVFDIPRSDRLKGKIEIIDGIMEEECKNLMIDFFKVVRS